MLALITLVAGTVLGCGADETSAKDAGAPDTAVREDAATADARSDAAAPPSADGLGLFGLAPSWFELLNEDGTVTGGFHFGRYRSGFTWPTPIVGDFDGDGFDSVGFYDPRAQLFHLDEGSGERIVTFGAVDRIPVAGDWDGDGVDGLGLYDPVTGNTELRDVLAEPGTTVAGPPRRFPLAADLTGDGTDTLMFYDGSGFTISDAERFALGPADGYPITGDFDGDGIDGVGVFDLEGATFHLWNELAERPADDVVSVAPANWVRVPIAGRLAVPAAASTGYPYETVSAAAAGVDGAGLDAASTALEAMPNLRSFLVLRDGALVHEAYFGGNGPQIAHNIKSVSKSLLATILLLAVDDGTVPEAPVASLLPAGLGDGDARRDRIELGHLLTMTAGLAWNEAGIGDWFSMDDWVAAVFESPMVAEPGDAFNYSTGNTHLGSAIITRAAGRGTDEYTRERLLAPLGIVAERWDRAPDGTPIGGAEVTMRPRDLARFGQLFLEDGSPGGTGVVPAAIIDAIRTEQVPASAIDGDLRYGAWWWIRSFGAADAYFAWGHGGQFVFVFPTLDAVVVVTSRSDVTGATSTAVSYDVFSVIEDHVVPAL